MFKKKKNWCFVLLPYFPLLAAWKDALTSPVPEEAYFLNIKELGSSYELATYIWRKKKWFLSGYTPDTRCRRWPAINWVNKLSKNVPDSALTGNGWNWLWRIHPATGTSGRLNSIDHIFFTALSERGASEKTLNPFHWFLHPPKINASEDSCHQQSSANKLMPFTILANLSDYGLRAAPAAQSRTPSRAGLKYGLKCNWTQDLDGKIKQ